MDIEGPVHPERIVAQATGEIVADGVAKLGITVAQEWLDLYHHSGRKHGGDAVQQTIEVNSNARPRLGCIRVDTFVENLEDTKRTFQTH